MGHRNLETVDKLTNKEHWQNFIDFCKFDMLSGGPDAHMTLSGHLSKGLPRLERIWHGGVYAGVYNVPTAELLWTMFPHKKMMKTSHAELTDWLTENWGGIATRRERKCVRIPANMAFYLKNFAEWAVTLNDSKFYDKSLGSPESRYEELWEHSQKSVKFLGRYSGFKFLEFATRYCDLPIRLPDIRPRGGWSPRSMLSILYPKYKDILLAEKDTPEILGDVNAIAEAALSKLSKAGLENMDMFKMEVFLCDYKQCYFGRRQYPGRSQDSEIEYYTKLNEYWDFDFQMLKARAEIFPSWALGELNGWDHVRKELGTVLYDYGYMWSDSLYDYKNTLDLSAPTSKVCVL